MNPLENIPPEKADRHNCNEPPEGWDGIDDPVERALDSFEHAWLSGERPDIEAFCKDHPECDSSLRNEILRFVLLAEGYQNDTPEITSDEKKAFDEKILGDFHIRRELGHGGMGTVYEAEQVSLKRTVALKILPRHLSFSDNAVLKFQREAEAGGRQSHHGIVAIYAVGEHEGVHYIAQELVGNGLSLNDRLDGYRKAGTQPPGYFREVARLVTEIAYALQHAHESGVIHRDIKPSNILLTEQGRPKVTDFGLAKMEDALALSRTGEFSGTPCYMSPEQAMSQRMGIDKRTDIYSLGVTLFEMLTLERPFDGKTSQEILKKIILFDPDAPHKANPKVPRDLSVICMKAIEKVPDKRYQTMKEFGDDLERFLSGDVILAKPSGLGTRLWKRLKRNPVASAVVSVTLAAVLMFAVVVPWIIAANEREKRDAEEKTRIEIEEHRKRAEAERDRALVAEREAEHQARLAEKRLEDFLRLSDVKLLSDLERESEELWPAYPEKVPALEAWIKRAEELVGRTEEHRNTLLELRGKTSSSEEIDPSGAKELKDQETAWWYETLNSLLSGLERLVEEEHGTLKCVRDRLNFATTIRKRSLEDFEALWTEAITSIADEEECPLYKGLVIEPMVGFVPIGRDPVSGLFEFAHLQTGEIPLRDTDEKLFLEVGMGLVFVLLPGGTFNMGAVLPSKVNPIGSPNVDPHARPEEGPVHEVTLPPFLLSKCEVTQGQWKRFTGENPSYYQPESYEGITLLHPVEQVSWEDCAEVLSKLKLRLPTESEWEYACRAGTTTAFYTGDDRKSLADSANLADSCCKSAGHPDWVYEEWMDDGYAIHAPVGCYEPNAFGLHDVHGNVFEWCEDFYNDVYVNAPTDGSAIKLESPSRTSRGGGWSGDAQFCRSAARYWGSPKSTSSYMGIRPALSIKEY